jgi:hypothetical protein
MDLYKRFIELHPEFKGIKKCGRGDIVWLTDHKTSGQVIDVIIPKQKFKVKTNTKTLIILSDNLERLF